MVARRVLGAGGLCIKPEVAQASETFESHVQRAAICLAPRHMRTPLDRPLPLARCLPPPPSLCFLLSVCDFFSLSQTPAAWPFASNTAHHHDLTCRGSRPPARLGGFPLACVVAVLPFAVLFFVMWLPPCVVSGTRALANGCATRMIACNKKTNAAGVSHPEIHIGRWPL